MQTGNPVHAPLPQFSVAENCLQVGGIALTRLAERVGGTPFYALDRSVLTDRMQQLKALLPDRLAVHYSIKANPMQALVQHMARLVDGFDVASAGELQLALATTMPVDRITFSGPGKTDVELLQALAAGVVVNAESAGELNRLQKIARRTGYHPRITLRINPDFFLKSSGLKMGGGALQFGIDAERVPDLLAELDREHTEVLGLHIYCGSQNLNAGAITEAQTRICDLAIALAEQSGHQFQRINLGGGFGIPYFPGELPLDMEAVARHLHLCVERLGMAMPEVRVEVESGRYLSGPAGIYVTRVIDKKYSRGKCFLVTDGGMNHHLAVTGNFGQVIRKNYPVAVGNKMRPESDELATVTGPLCTPLDLLADQMPLAHAEVGDLIVVFQSGAYGASASPGGFLSHPAVREVLV